jgi:hypothetical protein
VVACLLCYDLTWRGAVREGRARRFGGSICPRQDQRGHNSEALAVTRGALQTQKVSGAEPVAYRAAIDDKVAGAGRSEHAGGVRHAAVLA